MARVMVPSKVLAGREHGNQTITDISETIISFARISLSQMS